MHLVVLYLCCLLTDRNGLFLRSSIYRSDLYVENLLMSPERVNGRQSRDRNQKRDYRSLGDPNKRWKLIIKQQ